MSDFRIGATIQFLLRGGDILKTAQAGITSLNSTTLTLSRTQKDAGAASMRAAEEFEAAAARIGMSGKELETLQGRLQRTTRGFNSFGAGATRMGAAMSMGLTLPIVGFGMEALNTAAKMDALKRGLTAVTGSVSETERQFKDLREVAKLPGLGMEEAVQGAIRLQAAGLNADMSKRSLMGFGNALATVGKGKADLEGVIDALAKMEGRGRVSARQIDEIALRVPQIRQLMKAAFGTADTQALQQQGVTADQFVAKIVPELEKLPKVGDSIRNSMENMSDTVKMAMTNIGNAIIPVAQVVLDRLAPAIERGAEWFSKLPGPVKTTAVVVAGLVAVAGPALIVIGQISTGAGLLFGWMARLPGVLGATTAATGRDAAAARVAAAAYEMEAKALGDLNRARSFRAGGGNLAGQAEKDIAKGAEKTLLKSGEKTLIKTGMEDAAETGLLSGAKSFIPKLMGLFRGGAVAEAGGGMFSGVLRLLSGGLGGVVARILPAVAGFSRFLGPIGIAVSIIVTTVSWMATHWDRVQHAVKGVGAVLSGVLGVFRGIWGAIQPIVTAVASVVGWIFRLGETLVGLAAKTSPLYYIFTILEKIGEQQERNEKIKEAADVKKAVDYIKANPNAAGSDEIRAKITEKGYDPDTGEKTPEKKAEDAPKPKLTGQAAQIAESLGVDKDNIRNPTPKPTPASAGGAGSVGEAGPGGDEEEEEGVGDESMSPVVKGEKSRGGVAVAEGAPLTAPAPAAAAGSGGAPAASGLPAGASVIGYIEVRAGAFSAQESGFRDGVLRIIQEWSRGLNGVSVYGA